jgi:hypothetical protein
MKNEDFDDFLKLAVEDFEKEGKIDFNQKAVWNNVNRETKNKKFLLWIAASFFLFALSFSLIYKFNSSVKPQISDNKSIEKSIPQSQPNIKKEVLKNVPTIAKRSRKISEPETITSAPAHEEKPIDVTKKENIIDSTIAVASIISPAPSPNKQEILSVQFKRGTKQVITELQELKAEPAFTLSFKKAKPQKNVVVVDNSVAAIETNKNIYKIKL